MTPVLLQWLLLVALPMLVTCQQSGLKYPDGRRRVFTIQLSHDYGAQEYIDSKGYLSGFIHDLVDAVCQEANIDCRTVWDDTANCWTSAPGKRAYGGKGLHGRWYDGCSGYDATRERIHTFQFSMAYTKTLRTFFYHKKGEPFDERDLGQLTKPIGFVAGWAASETCVANLNNIQNNILPKDKIAYFDTSSDLLDAIKNGTVQAGFADEFTFNKDDISNLLAYESSRPYTCILAGNSIMSRKDNDFTNYWNLGFQKLSSTGRYRQLCQAGTEKHGHKGDLLCFDL